MLTNKKSRCSLWRSLLLISAVIYYSGPTEAITPEDVILEADETTTETDDAKVKVFTVATERTDGFLRYMRSARVYDIEVTPLGLDQEWNGGDMNGPGGGFKINLLRQAITPFKDDQDTIIMFTDSYDVIFTTRMSEILRKFKSTGAKLLFSAQKYCWPDLTLAFHYPKVEPKALPYLSSGAFIGYAPQIWALLETSLNDTDDDQLYYTKTFLNEEKRGKLGMKLDTTSEIFQNLNDAKDDIELEVDVESNSGTLKNINFLTTPSVIHGNGPSKVELNAFANYLANTFNSRCLICQENRLELDEKTLPVISLSIIGIQAVPFFDMALDYTASLNYPKNKMHLFVYSGVEYLDAIAKSHLKKFEDEYLSAKLVLSTDEFNERRARQSALQQAQQKKADYIFFVNADTHIDDPEVLRELLSLNKQFAAPVVSQYYTRWSNFWGALSKYGYYAESTDYEAIVQGDIIGMWNVPFVDSIYLIKNTAFKHINYDHQYFDPDIAMCESLRNAGVHMNIINDRFYGHVVNATNFDITVARPDFYTIFTNEVDWVKKYIHPNHRKQLESNYTYEQPCSDVYWFQVATEAFCNDLVDIVENNGNWAQNVDDPVPTHHIHMKQVNLDEVWLQFLDLIVLPLQGKVYYYYYPLQSDANFVVRYRPDAQASLNPHIDLSAYTINLALNHAGVDYEGGGCRFLRYDCSVPATKKGWLLMHPGRLTHYHEGLRVTNGTSYIMISFIEL